MIGRRKRRFVRRDQLNPDWVMSKRIQLMSPERFMDWVFADGYKGLPGALRALAAVKWCTIRWPDDPPDLHKAEAEAVFNAHDAA